MSQCRSCNAPIRWARTVQGSVIPLDPEPSPNGNLVLNDAGHVQHLDRDIVDPRDRYVSHFATCPDADRHRKKRKGAA